MDFTGIIAVKNIKGAWTSVPGGFNIVDGVAEQYLADTDLSVMHPDLPKHLHQNCQLSKEVTSIAVARLLLILQCPIQLPTTTGDMAAVTSIFEINVLDNTVEFEAYVQRYRNVTSTFDGGSFIEPRGITTTAFEVSQGWFDKNHEGWRERLSAATGLGCTPEEVVLGMLMRIPAVAQSEIPKDMPSDFSI